MNIKKLFLLPRFLLLVFLMIVGSMQCAAHNHPDSTYILLFPDQVTGRIFLGEKISVFDIEDHRHKHTLNYRPNNSLAIGLGVTIRGIGLNFSTRLPFHDAKEAQYGRTRRYDVQLHRYRGHLALDGYAQRYRGFHLNTVDDVTAITGTTSYPYFPNLTTLNIGAAAMYLFNGNRYTMRSGVNQQDWQLKSAGSFMVGAAFFARYIYNDTTLIPDNYRYPEVLEASGVRHIGNYGLTVRAGYGYNYVWKEHYFIGAAADIGAGPGYSIVRNLSGNERTGLGLNLSANMNFAAGYNAEKWFGGVYAVLHADRYDLPYDGGKVSNAQGIVRLVVARRFSTKKKLIKSSSVQ